MKIIATEYHCRAAVPKVITFDPVESAGIALTEFGPEQDCPFLKDGNFCSKYNELVVPRGGDNFGAMRLVLCWNDEQGGTW